MKATKKAGIILCVASILALGAVTAQSGGSGSSSGAAASAASTAPAPASSADGADLVAVMESDGDLTEVAEALSASGTDALLVSVPEGVTIFAPIDGSFGQDVVVEEVITSYIVPGMIDTSDIADDSSSTATSMSGSPVTIAVVDDVVTVNGVPVMASEAIYSGNVVIYKLSDSFDNDGLASSR